MQNLIKAIPSRAEWSRMGEEERELLSITLESFHGSYDLSSGGIEYHPAEIMALMAAKHPYLIDLIFEFDLGIDYDNA